MADVNDLDGLTALDTIENLVAVAAEDFHADHRIGRAWSGSRLVGQLVESRMNGGKDIAQPRWGCGRREIEKCPPGPPVLARGTGPSCDPVTFPEGRNLVL